MNSLRLAILASTALLWSASTSSAGYFTGIVSFGDSLSDTGNGFAATGYPPPPYYQGHFSNGPIWLEHLADRLGVAAPTPSLVGGTDYAFGGAETGMGNSSLGTPNIGSQIAAYLGAGGSPDAHQLFTLWAGGNDFLNAGQTDPSVPIANIASELTTLANAGARYFLVPNLPPLGTIPLEPGTPQAVRDALNQLSLAFNAELDVELALLRQSLGVTILRLDIAGLIGTIRAAPGPYGFTDTTHGALADGVVSGSGYLFWDEVHPTTAAHAIIGDAAYELVSSVPEPSSLALATLGLGGLGLAASQKRRGSRDPRSSGRASRVASR